jgi:hypothetical protein
MFHCILINGFYLAKFTSRNDVLPSSSTVPPVESRITIVTAEFNECKGGNQGDTVLGNSGRHK